MVSRPFAIPPVPVQALLIPMCLSQLLEPIVSAAPKPPRKINRSLVNLERISVAGRRPLTKVIQTHRPDGKNKAAVSLWIRTTGNGIHPSNSERRSSYDERHDGTRDLHIAVVQ